MTGRFASRRQILRAAAGAACLGSGLRLGLAQGGFRSEEPIFTLGVASGEPTANALVLWTRLAPDPQQGGGMPEQPVEVGWEIAEDEAFQRIAARGAVQAIPEDAHSVHVAVGELRPARWYWYRFTAAGQRSPVGRTRTLSAPDEPAEALRIGFATCQQYEQGYYGVLGRLAEAGPDLIVHLGDYVYENSWGSRKVRQHGTARPTTLAEYRERIALYKSDTDLQAAHAAAPWMPIWDDHEVEDNYTNDRSRHMRDPERFLPRRAAAYKAYWEHMPLGPAMRPSRAGALPLHRSRDFGRLGSLTLLDGRQYRSLLPCGNEAAESDCLPREDERRSLLGRAQEDWLRGALRRGQEGFSLLAQPVNVVPLLRSPRHRRSVDSWDGFPAARLRLIEMLQQAPNPAIFTGDLHFALQAHLHREPDDPDSSIVAPEFVSPSVTSTGRTQAELDLARPLNPHVTFAAGERHGFLLAELSEQRLTCRYFGGTDTSKRDIAMSELARFTVTKGQRRAERG